MRSRKTKTPGRRAYWLAIGFTLSALVLRPTTLAGSAETVPTLAPPGDAFGVFVRLIQDWDLTFQGTTDFVAEALREDGFQVLARIDVPASDDCGARAQVIVFHDDAYADALLGHGAHAAFALPLRMAVLEDETGIHALMLNPRSLNRTIVSETGVGPVSAALLDRLAAALGGQAWEDYGQTRTEGLIGKTMGVMAGGPFESKVEEVASLPVADVGGALELTERLAAGLAEDQGGWKWRLHTAYTLPLPDHAMGLIGLTSDRMLTDSFEIVGPGADPSRGDMACPGLDHAPAYPLELLVVEDGDRVRVLLIDVMFRMKMYFEDAGKMKFAMNMRMPGSIETEMRDKVEEALF